MAFQDGVKRAKPIILEPVMKVEVVAPEKFLGDVTGDLSAKRARIENLGQRAQLKVVDALVPLSEMFGYATNLRSMTEGRASYTMEFSRYEEVPSNVAAEIISGKKK
jgi:elongation factor G